MNNRACSIPTKLQSYIYGTNQNPKVLGDQKRDPVEYGLLFYLIKSASTSLVNINIHVRIQGHSSLYKEMQKKGLSGLTEECRVVLLKVTGNSILAEWCFLWN